MRRKENHKTIQTLKLNHPLFNNQWVSEKFKKETKKCLDSNKNEDTTYGAQQRQD
jgi:hypothetical protein